MSDFPAVAEKVSAAIRNSVLLGYFSSNRERRPIPKIAVTWNPEAGVAGLSSPCRTGYYAATVW